jgi:hypothetical protein
VEKESHFQDINDVQRLMDSKEKESTYLDYKESVALQNDEKSKTEISKDISAFANAGGGVIIYGVKEDGHIPVEIDDGLDPEEISKEWLDQVIGSRIRRKIEGVRISQIAIDPKMGNRVIYVVHIPQSMRAPHQAWDNKFYKRRNFSCEPMEEYEVRDAYMREEAPDVTLDLFFRRFSAKIEGFPVSLVSPDIMQSLEINGVLRNEGGGQVEYVAITLWFDARLFPETSKPNIEFRPLKLKFEDEPSEVDVLRADIKWGGPSKMPLFKTVEYRLLEKDLSIHFKHPWLQDENSPFILWEARAPRMQPAQGFLRLRIEDGSAVLKKEKMPVIAEITQEDRGRDFLGIPDLSLESDL